MDNNTVMQRASRVQDLLTENYKWMMKRHSVDPTLPKGVYQIMMEDEVWDSQMDFYKEVIPTHLFDSFHQNAVNRREELMESLSLAASIPRYEMLNLPMLALIYQASVAPEVCTNIVMNAPSVLKPIQKVLFQKSGSSEWVEGPYYDGEISTGPMVGFDTEKLALNGATTDVLAEAGVTSDNASLQRDELVIKTVKSATSTVEVNVIPDSIHGNAFFECELDGSPYKVQVHVDYENGTIDVTANDPAVVSVSYTAKVSMERNTISPKAKLSIVNENIVTSENFIESDFTELFQQDIKALYNIEIQSYIITYATLQIGIDNDKKMMRQIENAVLTANKDTFEYDPPSTFTHGPRAWHENILLNLARLSGKIGKSSKLPRPNILIMNEYTSHILTSLLDYNVGGQGMKFDLGFKYSATGNGEFKVYQTNTVEDNKIYMVSKPAEEKFATMYFGNYIPAYISNYPKTNIPTYTMVNRSAFKIIRPETLGEITINV